MNPFRAWFASLGFAAICLMAPGCGGGEEAGDASADASGAAAPDGAVAPEPTVAPAPAPVRAAAPARVAAAKPDGKKAEEPPAEETAQNSDDGKPAAAKPDTSSATAEMLAIAITPNGPAPGTPAPVPGAAPAPGAAGQPGGAPGANGNVMGPGGPMLSQGGGASGMMSGGPVGPGGGPGGPPPNAGRPDPGAMARNMAMNAPRLGGPGGPAMDGRDPAGNARPGSNKPADFRDPHGAVDAFLDALAAKDLTRLAEATALRAQEEASAKNRDLFRRIYDESLSESELSDLARSLEGYKISGENPPKSTGRVEVIVGKQGTNNDFYTHKITTRREKKGWGVLDIGPKIVFKSGTFSGRRGNSQSSGPGSRGG